MDDADAVVVRLDPGLAFGTGTHPTTALCLEWLDGLDLAGKTVIDYGCGSGVLAIAALKLGAARVDRHRQRSAGARGEPRQRRAQRRRRRSSICTRRTISSTTPADVLVANILAGPLAELAPRFAACVKPGGTFALSGILRGQEHELLERYASGSTTSSSRHAKTGCASAAAARLSWLAARPRTRASAGSPPSAAAHVPVSRLACSRDCAGRGSAQARAAAQAANRTNARPGRMPRSRRRCARATGIRTKCIQSTCSGHARGASSALARCARPDLSALSPHHTSVHESTTPRAR